jgi:hypothetical protein
MHCFVLDFWVKGLISLDLIPKQKGTFLQQKGTTALTTLGHEATFVENAPLCLGFLGQGLDLP